MTAGGTQSFACTVTNSTNTACSWSVQEGAAGGSIDANGLYTAPPAAGTYHVVATAEADGKTNATAAVAVTAQQQGSAPSGTWVNVTPANVDLANDLACGNYGAEALAADPHRPSDLYAKFDCQGIWKSTDYGQTWTGPINTGTNGANIDGAGGLYISSASTSTPTTIYVTNIRDPGLGFWKSTDGGVNWTQINIAPGGSRQDFYPPTGDPYDVNHLLMAGHEMDLLVQSTDGGQTWTAVPTAPGMAENGGTAFVTFVDTGNAATTRNTILWIAQQNGGTFGTWRTTDGGTTWTKVDNNEHPHGGSQVYQPGGGVIFMAGAYSSLGWGVLRSADSGQTWTHYGSTGNLSNVAGTPGYVYAMLGWAAGAGSTVDPSFEFAAQPGTGTWSAPGTPGGMTNGPASIAPIFDGTNHILVTANYNAGLWRYVEGGGSSTPAVSISVSPTTASAQVGTTTQFNATVSNSSDTAVIWSVQEGSACGSVSTSGLFTAPSTAGTCHVVATAHADSTKSATAAVTVTAATTSGARPQLSIVNGTLVDPHGNRVMLRGLSSQGMAMVYGNKANPGTYVPMTVEQYVQRAVQTDATGNAWDSTAVRLVFERFPCTDPSRLYTQENVPYAMPDTIAFAAWSANTSYAQGSVAAYGGTRYRAVKPNWRADRGQAWNPGAYAVGDVVSGYGNGNDNHIYKCTVASGAGPSTNWGGGPSGTSTTTPTTDAMGNQWLYIGEYGESGTAQPFSGPTVTDYSMGTAYRDNLVWWATMSPDYTPAQAEANFADWKAKVMDPAIAAAVAANLYVIVTDFDFGPAQHPLRHARMLDFWTRMAKSQWANNPQVIFELWNESEDVNGYSGGAGSWAVQKPVIQETVDAIRSAGANNIIVVPTPFYSAWVGEATASPLTGTNLAYALHVYRSQWEAYSSNRDQITRGLASGQAIMMTEWGDDTNPTDPAQTWATSTSVPPPLRQLIEPSEGAAHPVAGWFAWSLSNSWSPDLFSDAALTQPTPFGVAVRQWLFDKRGDSQPVP